MKNSIHLVIERYNEIGKFLDLPMRDLFKEIKKHNELFQLNYIFKKKQRGIVSHKFNFYQIYHTKNIVCLVKEHQFKFKETELIITDSRTPIELLKSRIVDHGIYPTYRLLRKNISGQKFVYHYACSLFGLYGE